MEGRARALLIGLFVLLVGNLLLVQDIIFDFNDIVDDDVEDQITLDDERMQTLTPTFPSPHIPQLTKSPTEALTHQTTTSITITSLKKKVNANNPQNQRKRYNEGMMQKLSNYTICNRTALVETSSIGSRKVLHKEYQIHGSFIPLDINDEQFNHLLKSPVFKMGRSLLPKYDHTKNCLINIHGFPHSGTGILIETLFWSFPERDVSTMYHEHIINKYLRLGTLPAKYFTMLGEGILLQYVYPNTRGRNRVTCNQLNPNEEYEMYYIQLFCPDMLNPKFLTEKRKSYLWKVWARFWMPDRTVLLQKSPTFDAVFLSRAFPKSLQAFVIRHPFAFRGDYLGCVPLFMWRCAIIWVQTWRKILMQILDGSIEKYYTVRYEDVILNTNEVRKNLNSWTRNECKAYQPSVSFNPDEYPIKKNNTRPYNETKASWRLNGDNGNVFDKDDDENNNANQDEEQEITGEEDDNDSHRRNLDLRVVGVMEEKRIWSSEFLNGWNKTQQFYRKIIETLEPSAALFGYSLLDFQRKIDWKFVVTQNNSTELGILSSTNPWNEEKLKKYIQIMSTSIINVSKLVSQRPTTGYDMVTFSDYERCEKVQQKIKRHPIVLPHMYN